MSGHSGARGGIEKEEKRERPKSCSTRPLLMVVISALKVMGLVEAASLDGLARHACLLRGLDCRPAVSFFEVFPLYGVTSATLVAKFYTLRRVSSQLREAPTWLKLLDGRATSLELPLAGRRTDEAACRGDKRRACADEIYIFVCL